MKVLKEVRNRKSNNISIIHHPARWLSFLFSYSSPQGAPSEPFREVDALDGEFVTMKHEG